MNNEKKPKREKRIVFLIGAALIIGALSLFAIFSSAVMGVLGFTYESLGGFILYFIIASVVSYPLNLIAGALPKALLGIGRMSKGPAVCLYVLLDTAATFCGFGLVDSFMPSVSANGASIAVLALVFALFGLGDLKGKTDL